MNRSQAERKTSQRGSLNCRALFLSGVALLFAFAHAGYCDWAWAQDEATDGEDLAPKPTDSGPEQNNKPDEKPKDKPLKPLNKPKLIDTSIEEEPAQSQAPGKPEEKSPEYLAREAKLAESLKKLIQAPHVYDNSKGGSSDLTTAFMQAAKEGPKLRADLLFMVENGSPAGKIYGASLIRLFDPATGNKILNDFKAVKTLVNNKTYVSQEHYTTGEMATDLLSGSPTIQLKSR